MKINDLGNAENGPDLDQALSFKGLLQDDSGQYTGKKKSRCRCMSQPLIQ